MMPATPPITTADIGETKPDPGVIATRPATAPDAAPSIVGLPEIFHSTIIQLSAAAAAAIWVTTKAVAASPLAPSAEPPLKPNQPTHNKDAPITANGRLCGGAGDFSRPTLLPIISTATRAETPELI